MTLTFTPNGANISTFSANATAMWFCMFEGGKETQTPLTKSADVFSAHVPNLKPGAHYGLRAEGPWDEAEGHRFDKTKLLLDPYALELTAHSNWHPELAIRGAETAHLMPKCIAREALAPVLRQPSQPKFILEVNTKAFSKLNPAIPEHLRGTVAALAHPASIAHFKRIGCDTIELMPITAWTDERHLAPLGLTNAWGYNPVSYFAPEPNLAPGGEEEIRATLKTLHQAGIKVLLDVVYNHTGESDFGGGTISLRGLDHKSYYRMDGPNLINDSGCGNSLALHEAPAMNLALASLRHWASMGFDGFRYDLATALGRLPDGFSVDAPLIKAIEADEILAPLIHIAEPWDVGPGGYHLGKFPHNWLEWNDKFRDDMRKFWRCNSGNANDAATRISGSQDIFQGRKPSASINFLAAHDGFTLADMLNYDTKQNLTNGENNRDGSSHELCWIDAAPKTKIKAMLASLFFARGTIMLTAGDEFGRTQKGNNNTYAQDNELNWLDWVNADQELIDYVAELTNLRHQYTDYLSDEFLSNDDCIWIDENGAEIKEWYGRNSFGLSLKSKKRENMLCLFFSSTTGFKLSFAPNKPHTAKPSEP